MADDADRSQNRYAQVADAETGYEPPAGASSKRYDVLSDEICKSIDAKSKEVPEDKLSKFRTLVRYLTKGLHSDVHKVRAIFYWIGQQNVMSTTEGDESDDHTNVTDQYSPRGYLTQISEDADIYSKLFAIMCREANIPCVVLHGHCRAGDYEVGDDHCGRSSWNAVYAAGWRLVHCRWAFEVVQGRQATNCLELERDGIQRRQHIEMNEGETRHNEEPNESYFFTDPEVFIYEARPDNYKWQLLSSPVSKKRFLVLPHTTPQFAESGFTFRRGQNGILYSKQGIRKIAIKALGYCKGEVRYSLLYKKNDEYEFPESHGAERFVVMLNKDEDQEIKFVVRCPVEGRYILRMKELKGNVLSRMCDFMIICEERQRHCRVLPLNPTNGWGPGPVSKKAGISNLSHNEGLIETKTGQQIVICFNNKGKKKFDIHLKSSIFPDNVANKFLKITQHRGHVVVRLDADAGEYALTIDKGDQNALNYLIEFGGDHKRPEGQRENATEKRARQSLIEATASDKKSELETCIKTFIKLQLEDGGDLIEAEMKLKTIHLNETLRFAMMKGRVDQLKQAIKLTESSPAADLVQGTLNRAKACLRELLGIRKTPRPVSPITKKTMAELRMLTPKVIKGPVLETFTSMFILLGEKMWTVQDSNYIVQLLKRHGRDSLLARLHAINPEQIPDITLTDARRLLSNQQTAKLRRISQAVEKVYIEGISIIKRCERNSSGSTSIRSDTWKDQSMSNAED